MIWARRGVADAWPSCGAGVVELTTVVCCCFKAPKHAYTQALLAAIPSLEVPLRYPAPARRRCHFLPALVLDDVRVQFRSALADLALRRLCAPLTGSASELGLAKPWVWWASPAPANHTGRARSNSSALSREGGCGSAAGDALTQSAIGRYGRDIK